jgi:hypothetical protein
MFEKIKQLCLPSLIYLILAVVQVLASIGGGSATFIGTTIYVLFVAFWTWILDLICKAGYEVISWILVFLPIIFGILIFVFLIYAVKNMSPANKKEFNKEIQKEIENRK